jgi:hypothetical protein
MARITLAPGGERPPTNQESAWVRTALELCKRAAFDTAAGWGAADDTVLENGQLGVETDTGRAKIGNGTDTWAELLYTGGGADFLSLLGGTMEEGAAISFFNAAALRAGSPNDQVVSGAGGLEQICSIGFIDRWESGMHFFFNQSNQVRIVTQGTFTPTNAQDTTKRFVVGSLWEMLDGAIYACTDAAEGAAVWRLLPGNAPLQLHTFDPSAGDVDLPPGVTLACTQPNTLIDVPISVTLPPGDSLPPGTQVTIADSGYALIGMPEAGISVIAAAGDAMYNGEWLTLKLVYYGDYLTLQTDGASPATWYYVSGSLNVMSQILDPPAALANKAVIDAPNTFTGRQSFGTEGALDVVASGLGGANPEFVSSLGFGAKGRVMMVRTADPAPLDGTLWRALTIGINAPFVAGTGYGVDASGPPKSVVQMEFDYSAAGGKFTVSNSGGHALFTAGDCIAGVGVHGFNSGDPVFVYSGANVDLAYGNNTHPGNFSPFTCYYVLPQSSSAIKLSATLGGAPIAWGSAGSAVRVFKNFHEMNWTVGGSRIFQFVVHTADTNRGSMTINVPTGVDLTDRPQFQEPAYYVRGKRGVTDYTTFELRGSGTGGGSAARFRILCDTSDWSLLTGITNGFSVTGAADFGLHNGGSVNKWRAWFDAKGNVGLGGSSTANGPTTFGENAEGILALKTGVEPGLTKGLSATVQTIGAAATNGTYTVVGTTGTTSPAATYFRASVTYSAGGTVAVVDSITFAGNYLTDPTNIAAEPVAALIQAQPANATARLALTGLLVSAVVRQVDTGDYYRLTNAAAPSVSGSWAIISIPTGLVLNLTMDALTPAPADIIQLFSADLSGDTTLGLRVEKAVAADASLASTHSLTVKINGVKYKMPLVLVP